MSFGPTELWVKLNVMTVTPEANAMNEMKTSSSFTYMLVSFDLWHGRLWYINFDTLCRLINLDHILAFKIKSNNKCQVCIETKLTRQSFHTIQRDSKPLDLIHIDISDQKFV